MAPVTRNEQVGGRQPKWLNAFGLLGPNEVADCLALPAGGRRWKVLEAHFSSIDHPLVADRPSTLHIPGAIQIHPSYLEAGTDRSKYYPFYAHPSDGDGMARTAGAISKQWLNVDEFSQICEVATDVTRSKVV